MSDEESEYLSLYRSNLIPLRVCLVGLTWGLHDYFITLDDEIRHIWPQRLNFAKFMFLFIRYYTLALLMFDVVQIHVFSIPGVTSDNLCVAMDSIIRVVGAISLWSVEIIMQLRIYALFNCSKRVAIANSVLFLASIAGFIYILVHNAERRRAVIASAIALPLPGCPSIHSGIEWAQWVPATIYEVILFIYALYKTIKSARLRNGVRISLHTLLLRDNLLYFFGIACILIFNNLMVVGVTHIPWFSYAPFHAAVGILTTRMILNVRKAASRTSYISRRERDLPVLSRDPVYPDTIPDSMASWMVAQNSRLPSSYDHLDDDSDSFPTTTNTQA
ncbi:hypothetical protein EV361DRAFT_908158 [Lentinula raphanica]|uniref:DUF6533 domain-containing protein n=1 Tax=Lentinula raphanica TaxID=153919 RepID=A0AA38P689_9AGAR|nr:hypothetical protein F5878DRAFT_234609 [Lentinula raphanica]KAJ3971992.1 hypothetical protein EV361DRAFT_908158 [Lentinula raphanica]